MMWDNLADSFYYKLLVGWLFNDEYLYRTISVIRNPYLILMFKKTILANRYTSLKHLKNDIRYSVFAYISIRNILCKLQIMY